MSAFHKDKELEQFRQIMEVPKTFEKGFRASSFIGAMFLALVMIPGALYMELMAGMGIGPAAQWVTVILFIEIAKRANKMLSRAEIFILFYLSGAIVAQHVHGTPLFRQFVVSSEAAVSAGLTNLFGDHSWIAPDPNDVTAYQDRSFFTWAWLPFLALYAFRMFMTKLDHAVVSYGLFRQASDVERLPFPMAPVGAQGIMALAEDQEQKVGEHSLRWRLFAIGGAIGMVGGLLYLAIPTLSGPLLNQTYSIFPMPFIDLNPYIEDILPAAVLGISFDFGQLMFGMVMPFWAVLGSFLGAMALVFVNPFLYWLGDQGVTIDNMPILGNTWQPGMSLVETQFANNVDFYFSFTIGISLVVAYIGISSAFRRKRSMATDAPEDRVVIPEGRGDIPTFWILLCYFGTSVLIVAVSGYLIEWHFGIMMVLLFYAFLYTPIISYVTARLEGLAGQVIEIPFIREMSFLLSGYEGVAIWFLPIPKANYGIHTVAYRQAELTGTNFHSIWLTEALLFPIILLATIGFSSFIWSLAPIPGPNYPYTMEVWEFEAKNACLLWSATLGEFSQFDQALSLTKIGIGVGAGGVLFGTLTLLQAPVMIFYGMVKGLSGAPIYFISVQFIGALLGKVVFEPKFGPEWKKHISVISAGFFCGYGLIGMLCIGIVFLKGSISTLPY